MVTAETIIMVIEIWALDTSRARIRLVLVASVVKISTTTVIRRTLRLHCLPLITEGDRPADSKFDSSAKFNVSKK